MSTLRRILHRVRAIADATDRWFVSLSRGIPTPGSAALSPPDLPQSETEPGPEEAELEPSIEVLQGISVCGPVTEPAPVPRGAPAGILPLLRALARVMGRHESTDYRTLPADERFWGLLHVVHDLGSPAADSLDLPTPSSPTPTR